MQHLYACRWPFAGEPLLNWLHYQKLLRNHSHLYTGKRQTLWEMLRTGPVATSIQGNN